MFSYLIQYPYTEFLLPSSHLNKYIHKMSLKNHILFHRNNVLFLISVAKIADNMKSCHFLISIVKRQQAALAHSSIS